MKYLAYDGTVFEQEDKCLEHEKQLDIAADEKRQSLDELKQLEHNFRKCEKAFADGLLKYFNKYGHLPAKYSDVVTLAVVKRVFPWM